MQRTFTTNTLCSVRRVTRERWWERRPGPAGMVVLGVLYLAVATFFGIEDWGHSTAAAFGVAVLTLVLFVVIFRGSR